MAKLLGTTKRIQLNKANVLIVVVVSVACFVTIFSLTASKALFGQLTYQNTVINKKEEAKKQLVASKQAREQLNSQYQLFVGNSQNIIGGNTTGTQDRDGDSAKIVLDALPSKYDYPALATSLEKILTTSGLSINSITGTDDELNQSAEASGTPQPVDMPFTLDFTGSSQATQDFLSVMQRSIRPIQVQQMTLTGTDGRLTTNVTAKTYFQPEKTFTVKNEVVKR